MRKFVKDFRAFALKGNAIDLAVGVIIGTAFGQIVNSLVKDIINPPLGLLTGNIDFSEKVLVLKSATETATAVTLNYGVFLNAIINFVIVAIAIFFVIRYTVNLMKKEEKNQEKKPSEEVVLLQEIRDILKK